MTRPSTEITSYYSHYGPMTDPGSQRDLYEDLPPEIPELCRVVQGLLLHVFWAERYGVMLSPQRELEAGIRRSEQMLSRIQEIESGSLTSRRESQNRLVGNCRTFSVVLTSMLQHQGIPARARCGFGRYFLPGWHEDHWVCEYWEEEEKSWVLVDAQLDEFQIRELKVTFDPTDVPRDQFIVAGKAWNSCRGGHADPDKFGIFDMHGLWFIRGNFVRDVAALNKMELLPWDVWGLMDRRDEDLTEEEMELLDQVASMTFDKVDFEGIRTVYSEQAGFSVPRVIKSYTKSGPQRIELTIE